MTFGRLIAIPAAAVLLACESRTPQPAMSTVACTAEALRAVERFGAHLRAVSTLAPGSVISREITAAYTGLVAASLLDNWRRDPGQAPGRQVSNPWPARIEVKDTAVSGSACKVSGEIVYVTTADTTSAVDRAPVVLELTNRDGWLITAYDGPHGAAALETGPSSTQAPEADSTPHAIVRSYYAAINARQYRQAYVLWSQDGAASGKSLAEFTKGFAETRSVRATVADSVLVEGAAGSQYATVAVAVDAMLKDGTRQHFTGTYTLRRAMVDGATPTQRTWHIYSAHLSGTP